MAASADLAVPARIGARWWLRRPAWPAGAALLTLAAAAWVFVIRDGAGAAAGMDGMGMSDGSGPGLGSAAVFVGSWGVMMAAMMLPSATPMVALYATIRSAMAARSGRLAAPTAVFVAPYLLVWLLTRLPVYLVSATLTTFGREHPGLAAIAPYAPSAVLALAGAYQFSHAK